MNPLSGQRCFNHPHREAVVRCPDCGRFFCRECVTEHDDRMLCANCLAGQGKRSGGQGAGLLAGLAKAVQPAVGFLVLWLVFYYLGQALLSLPSSFHEGTIWQKITSSSGPEGQ